MEAYTTPFRRLDMAAANVDESRALITSAMEEME